MIKNFLLILSLMLIPLLARSSDEQAMGHGDQDLRWQRLMDNAVTAIQRSHKTRDYWTGRTVAGLSEKDKKWASEYETLMKDESEKDYLNIAEKL